MRNIVYIIAILFFVGCDSDSAPDCFKTAGSWVQKSVTVAPFTEITAFKDITLIVTEAANYSVKVESRENLIDGISVVVKGGVLLLKDSNDCNLARSYGVTTIHVSAPNITRIRNSSQFKVSSRGVLNYPSLTLISEDHSGDFYNTGTFELEVNATNIVLTNNGTTACYISGTTTNLRVNHASGDGRFEGRNLIADNVNIYHRGSNDIIVNPQQKLTANLVSTGNVIAVNKPSVLDLKIQYDGTVVFE